MGFRDDQICVILLWHSLPSLILSDFFFLLYCTYIKEKYLVFAKESVTDKTVPIQLKFSDNENWIVSFMKIEMFSSQSRLL